MPRIGYKHRYIEAARLQSTDSEKLKMANIGRRSPSHIQRGCFLMEEVGFGGDGRGLCNHEEKERERERKRELHGEWHS